MRNIRGNDEIEGHIIANFPEVLQIADNHPIEVCLNCLRELNDLNNNSEVIRKNKSQNRSRNQSSISNSENNIVQSESVQDISAAPLTSSVTGNVQIPPSLDLEKLKEPGAIEKLVPNNRNVQRNVRQLLAKPMPVAAKKRKLQEMLDNGPIDNADNAGQRSSSNSQSETVIERPPQSGQDAADEMFRDLVNRSERLNRTYRSNSSVSSNESQISFTRDNVVVSVVRDMSSQAVVPISQEVSMPPPSPAIRERTQQSQPQRSQAVLYEPDSSSDSNRSKGSGSSDNDPRRRGSKRVASRNPSMSSDDGPAARKSKEKARKGRDEQAAKRLADEQAARNNADRPGVRQRNDGNDHSNLAAPRRVNLDPPSTTRNLIQNKDMNGG
jgi:hypothetical protein